MDVLGFDNCLVHHLIQEFEPQYGNLRAICRPRTTCECAVLRYPKPHEFVTLFEGIDVYTFLVAANFEDLFSTTLDPAEQAFRNPRIDKSTIHEIILGYSYPRILRIMNIVFYFYNGKELDSSVTR
ncbi:Hsp70 protein [Flagelloscypha sp. PMI_526]|nr:Hsp70 protein [Flagelloscypha sp. PMI_526]